MEMHHNFFLSDDIKAKKNRYPKLKRNWKSNITKHAALTSLCDNENPEKVEEVIGL